MLIDTARLLLRRWRLVVAALLVTCGIGLGAFLVTPLTYESRAQVLFLPPVTLPDAEGPINPFLALGPALGVTADIVRLGVSDDSTRARLVEQGAIEEYEVVSYLAENGGPILNISAEGRSRDQVTTTVDLVVDRVAAELSELQESADAPTTSLIRSVVLTETPEPEPSYKNRFRSLAVAAVASLVLLLAAIVVGDRMVRRSRRRAADARALAADDAGAPAPTADDDGVPAPTTDDAGAPAVDAAPEVDPAPAPATGPGTPAGAASTGAARGKAATTKAPAPGARQPAQPRGRKRGASTGASRPR